jgi:excinuclease ABC subunit C
MKSAYRKFNIKGDDLTPGDDFGMMKEVLNRRFRRLLKEDPFRKSENWPGLILDRWRGRGRCQLFARDFPKIECA